MISLMRLSVTRNFRKVLPCLAIVWLAFSCCSLSAQQPPVTISVSVPASPFPVGENVAVQIAATCAPSCGYAFVDVDGVYTLGTGLEADGTMTTYALSGLPIGPHTIQAFYHNQAWETTATSPIVNFTVVANNLPIPTGTVRFNRGFPIAGTNTSIKVAFSCGSGCAGGPGYLLIDDNWAGFAYLDSNGTATYGLQAIGPQFTVGRHNVTFRFFGNARYSQTTPSPTSFDVFPPYSQQAVGISIAVPASPFPEGENVPFRIASTCAPSCGIVFVFVDGQYVQGTGLEADGSITTYGLNTIGVGDHIIQAVYQAPQSGAAPSASPPVNITVIQNTLTPPTGTITFNPSSPVSGGTAVMKIALSCGMACGPSVGFVVMDDVYLIAFTGLDTDGTWVSTINIDNSKPWWTTGSHTASFRFFGNANYRQIQLPPTSYTVSSTGGRVYDSGQVTLTVNGVSKSVPYGQSQNATSSAVASSLASAINADANAAVSATTNGSALNLAAKSTGAASNYAFNVSQAYDTQNFTQPSFAANPASGTLTGGANGGTSTPSTIYSFSVTDASDNSSYAANGNVVAYKDSVNGTWTSLTYDSLNRLTGGKQVPVGGAAQYFCWTYDSFGNRTLQSSSSAPYTGSGSCQTSAVPTTYAASYNANNQIIQTPLSTPAYDAAGNITSDDHNQYLYDDEGRVCAVYAPPPMAGMLSMTQYIYDAEGRRVAKGTITSFSCNMATNGFSLTASYVLGQGGEQVTEMNGGGQWVHTNVFAGGQLMATYDPDGTHFQITDWLGSRRVQADYQGRVEATYQNLPFGEFVPSNTNPQLGATEHHFTGKERDSESGLDYFPARYYASNMGRFMSPDYRAIEDDIEPVPYADLKNPQSLNLYSYGGNNPLSQVDPSGHVHCDADTSSTGKDGSLTVTAGACHADFSDFVQFFRTMTRQDAKEIGVGILRQTASNLDSTKNCPNCKIGIIPLGMTEGLGLGVTGTKAATTIAEKLALEAAEADPATGKVLQTVLKDSRFPAVDGWVKMESRSPGGVVVHWVRNTITGAAADFKLK